VIEINDSGIIHPAGTTTFVEIDNVNAAVSAVGVFQKPNPNAVLFEKLTHASFKIPAGFKAKVNATIIQTVSDYTVTVNAPVAGTDYKVFAKEDGSFYADTVNAGTDKLIGGFHYGLVPSNFVAINNLREEDAVAMRGIRADSFWDLKWRPACEPEGMTYNPMGFWNDIYKLNSEHIVNGTSKAGATIAGGEATNGRAFPKIPLRFGGNGTLNYGKFDWNNAHEIASSHGKRLMTFGELSVLAYGVQESASAGALDDGTIKHIPNHASRYMEQATGVQWTWSRDNWSGNAAFFGGSSDSAASSSSRHGSWTHAVSTSSWALGSRFACDHLNLAQRTEVSGG
jgi:hypothetical protein